MTWQDVEPQAGGGISQASVEGDEAPSLGLGVAPDQGGGELEGIGGPQWVCGEGLLGEDAQPGGGPYLRPAFGQAVEQPAGRRFLAGIKRALPDAARDRRGIPERTA